MFDRRIFLKVKIKSLAAEARIIRTEEQRRRTWRAELEGHRIKVVRAAARHTLLAYGFLRGRPYRRIEPTCATPPAWKEVERMVRDYGVPRDPRQSSAELAERIKRWSESTA